MKVYCYSDLHTEFYNGNIGRTLQYEDFADADLVVLAGDCAKFSNITYIMDWLKASGKEYLYIPGNHEFYGRSWMELEKVTKASTQIINIKGKVIVASPLWTYIPDTYMELVERGMTDFRVIKDFTGKKQNEINSYCKEFVRKALVELKVDLVVTHHAPSYQSVLPQWQSSYLNSAFANDDLDELIKDRGPRFWFHGHMHDSMAYKIGSTTVFTNPHGYIKLDQNPEFDKKLHIEI